MKCKRKKLFVDREVQGPLVLRVVTYWLACMVTLELLRLTWQIASGPEQPSFFAYFASYDWPAAAGRMMIGLVLLAPIVWDVLNFSNRFAGPVFRMRRVLRDVAQGRPIEHIKLRQGDYWTGMADDMNAAFARLANDRGGPAAEHDADDDASVTGGISSTH